MKRPASKARFPRLARTILDALDPYMSEWVQNVKGAFQSVFSIGPPKPAPQPQAPPRQPPSPHEEYWVEWFRECAEVIESQDRLNECLVYLGHFPSAKVFRIHQISKARWMQYHIEMYLQEQYILYGRLTRFMRKVQRLDRRRKDFGRAQQLERLEKDVRTAFGAVLDIRGGMSIGRDGATRRFATCRPWTSLQASQRAERRGPFAPSGATNTNWPCLSGNASCPQTISE